MILIQSYELRRDLNRWSLRRQESGGRRLDRAIATLYPDQDRNDDGARVDHGDRLRRTDPDNPVRPELAPVKCLALADTGAVHLSIPAPIALQLAMFR